LKPSFEQRICFHFTPYLSLVSDELRTLKPTVCAYLYQLLQKAGFVHREVRMEQSNHGPVSKRKGMNPLAEITNKDEKELIGLVR
jgi:hypothetical protein